MTFIQRRLYIDKFLQIFYITRYIYRYERTIYYFQERTIKILTPKRLLFANGRAYNILLWKKTAVII